MIYVFCGPSVEPSTISSILPGCTVLPPVKAADLLKLVNSTHYERPTHVHIIDGLFYSTLSVRHKEILHLISQGITVSGSSSMGALRAAELSQYGMQGFGRIYDFFSSQLISSDDEVAIAHAQNSPFTPLTIPLINIRLSLHDLVADGLLDEDSAKLILLDCQALHFTERTPERIRSLPCVQRHLPSLIDQISDWKYLDAIYSLRHLDSVCSAPAPLRSPVPALPIGTNLINYYLDALDSPSSETSKLDSPSFQDIFAALNLQSALLFASQLRIQPSEAHISLAKTYLLDSCPGVSSAFANDHERLDYYAKSLVTLLMIHVAVHNHNGLYSLSKPLADSLVLGNLFSDTGHDALGQLMAQLFGANSFLYQG